MYEIFLYHWSETSLIDNILQNIPTNNQEKIKLILLTNEEILFTNTTEISIEILQHGNEINDFIQKLNEKLNLFSQQISKINYIINNDHSLFQQAGIHTVLSQYGEKCILVEEEVQLQIQAEREKVNLLSLVDDFIQTNSFVAIREVLPMKERTPFVQELLQFGTKLLSLDIFDKKELSIETMKKLKDVLAKNDADVEEQNYVDFMTGLLNKEQLPFIHYLYSYCDFLYENNQLVDFIVLYYRLAEELLLYGIGYNIHSNPQIAYKQRLNGHKAFALRKEDGRALFRTYQKCLERTYNRNQSDKYVQQLYNFYNAEFIQLLQLRHEGISGHGFNELSKEKIELYAGGISPMVKIDMLCELVGINVDNSIFLLIQSALLSELHEKMMVEN